MDYRQIIYLASYPKSGNTWLRAFLEAYYTGKVDINNLTTSVSDSWSLRSYLGDNSDPADYPLEIQQLIRPAGLVKLVRFYNQDVEKGYNIPLFVKTHSAHLVTNGTECLPLSLTKKVVYLIRDPRDVVISYAKHMGASVDEAIDHFNDDQQLLSDDRGERFSDFMSSWRLHVESYANSKALDVQIFRYEDLKSHPLTTFRAILEHIGEKVDNFKLRQAIKLTSFKRLKAQEKQHGFNEKSNKSDVFFDKGKSRYREVLSEEQIRKIVSTNHHVMERYGYRQTKSHCHHEMQNRQVRWALRAG